MVPVVFFVSVYLRCVLVYEAGAFSLARVARVEEGTLQNRSFVRRPYHRLGRFLPKLYFYESKPCSADPSQFPKDPKKIIIWGARDTLRNSRSRRTHSRYVTTPTELSRGGVSPSDCLPEARARARPTSVGLLA